jgi:hypothetical protein
MTNARRWLVALPAFRAVGKRDGRTQIIADAILRANNTINPLHGNYEAPTDTVEKLARAYKYFLKLYCVDPKRARQVRRDYGYSRFALMWDNWLSYEFDIAEKGFEYLEAELSNQALNLFVEDVEDNVPKWKRTSTSMYRNAVKLLEDADAAPNLRRVAEECIKEYDKTFPRPPKNMKTKVTK